MPVFGNLHQVKSYSFDFTSIIEIATQAKTPSLTDVSASAINVKVQRIFVVLFQSEAHDKNLHIYHNSTQN